MDVLISYDIADTEGEGAKRLRKVAQVCEKYGVRVQLSVFECRLSPSRVARMLGEVQDVIDARVDSFHSVQGEGLAVAEDPNPVWPGSDLMSLDEPWVI